MTKFYKGCTLIACLLSSITIYAGNKTAKWEFKPNAVEVLSAPNPHMHEKYVASALNIICSNSPTLCTHNKTLIPETTLETLNTETVLNTEVLLSTLVCKNKKHLKLCQRTKAYKLAKGQKIDQQKVKAAK